MILPKKNFYWEGGGGVLLVRVQKFGTGTRYGVEINLFISVFHFNILFSFFFVIVFICSCMF